MLCHLCLHVERLSSALFSLPLQSSGLNSSAVPVCALGIVGSTSQTFVQHVFMLSFSPPPQFQLQMFDIVCSLAWTSRDRCCDLPSMVGRHLVSIIHWTQNCEILFTICRSQLTAAQMTNGKRICSLKRVQGVLMKKVRISLISLIGNVLSIYTAWTFICS